MFYEALGLMSVATCGAGIYYCYSQGNLTPENVEKYMEMTDKAIMDCGEKFVAKVTKLANDFDNFMSREIHGTNRETQTQNIIEDVSYSPQSPASEEETELQQVTVPLITRPNVSSDEFIVLDEEDRQTNLDVQI